MIVTKPGVGVCGRISIALNVQEDTQLMLLRMSIITTCSFQHTLLLTSTHMLNLAKSLDTGQNQRTCLHTKQGSSGE